MDTQAPVVESTPDLAPEPVEAPEPAVSIADHASQFSPTRPEPTDTDEIPKTPANTGQFANKRDDVRHRSATQRATPEDVAEINKLTKELRELEGKVADRDPDAKAAPRLKTLKRQIAALRALDAPKSEEPKPTQTRTTAPAVSREFTEQEPVFEDFSADPAKYPDPLAAWMKATARYESRRDRWEESQQQATASQQAQDQQEIEQWHAHQAAFTAKTPDYVKVVSEFFQRDIGPVMVRAITKAGDKGPAFSYHLAQHPELADELILLTYGKPVEDAFVATVQRRLTQALQGSAVPTRSATPPRPFTPPTPPNLVRTGPVKADDEPPGEGASIADHQRYYRPKRR
jgi:hypothetical protein